MRLCGTIAISFYDYGGIHDYAKQRNWTLKRSLLLTGHCEGQDNLELEKAG